MKSKSTYVLIILLLALLFFSLERSCDHDHQGFVHPFLKRVKMK